MNIWKFQDKITSRLGLWAIFSMILGVWMARSSDQKTQGAGIQFLGWGLINAGIATGGQILANRRRKNFVDPNAPAIVNDETRKLARLLWVNSVLDIFYVLGGASLMNRRSNSQAKWHGQGVGIMIQGGFLFFFDLLHALKLQTTMAPPLVQPSDES